LSRPLQISPDTAIKLSQELNIPLEQLMHMPKHILLQKLAQITANQATPAADEGRPSPKGDEQP